MYFQSQLPPKIFLLALLCFFTWGRLEARYSEPQIDSIKQSLTSVQDTQLANSYIRLASSLYISDDDALDYSHKLVKLSDSIQYRHGLVRGYYIIGHINHYKKHFEEAIGYYKKGLKVSLDDQVDEDILKGYNYISTSLFYLEEWDSAHHYNSFYREAAIRAGDSITLAYTYSKEGSYLFNQNLIDLSIQSHLKASKICEKLRDTIGLIDEFGTLAMILERKGENEDAIGYYRKAIDIGQGSSFYHRTVAPLSNLAILFLEEKLLDSVEAKLLLAKKYLNEEEAIYSLGRDVVREDKHTLTTLYCNLRVAQGRYQEALDIGEALLKAQKELLEQRSYGSILFALSRANLGLKRYVLAEKQAQEALTIRKELQTMDDYLDVLLHLAELEYERSNFKKAYQYRESLASLKDSLNEKENKKAYKALMLEYETERKENEISRLTQAQLVSRSRRNLLMGSLIGLFILGLGLVLFLRFRVVKNKELWEQGMELHKIKSRFFTQISHELRTPLTLILGPLSQMKETHAQSEDMVKISMMERNAQRLLHLVNQVMDLSKLQAGKLELHAAPVSLNTQLKYIFSSFDSKAEVKKLDYQLSLPDEDVELYLDVDKFHQIVSNLLSNGCKFTPEDGRLHMSARNLEQKVEVTLTDNGPGIPPEQLIHVFDPYFQADGAHQTDEAGTGIGLALTKELVELHGGTIVAESEVGSGSRFILTFRRGKDHLTEEQINYLRMPEENLPKMEVPIEQVGKERQIIPNMADAPLILLAEDIPDMREFIRSVLETNFRLIFAPNGEEALKMAKEETPDIIISDIMMPIMDGIAFIKELKTNKLTDHIPVIFLTAKSSMEDRLTGWEHMAQAFLTKPFNPRELLLVIQSALEGQKNLQYRFRGEVILKPAEVAISSQEAQFLTKLTDFLEANIDHSELSIEELASEMALSRSQFNRKLKALTNKTPTLFVRNFRLQRAKQLLEQGFGNVSEVADAVGFSSLAYFSRIFSEEFGKSPSQWLVNKESPKGE